MRSNGGTPRECPLTCSTINLPYNNNFTLNDKPVKTTISCLTINLRCSALHNSVYTLIFKLPHVGRALVILVTFPNLKIDHSSHLLEPENGTKPVPDNRVRD